MQKFAGDFYRYFCVVNVCDKPKECSKGKKKINTKLKCSLIFLFFLFCKKMLHILWARIWFLRIL